MEIDENPFAHLSIEEIQAMMGTKLSDDIENLDDIYIENGEEFGDYPESFDSRQEWGAKIHSIRNQGK